MTYTDASRPAVTMVATRNRLYSTPQRYGIIAAVLDAAIASGHGSYATGMIDCAAATSDAHPPHAIHVSDVQLAHVVSAANGGAWRETNALPMCATANAAQGDADVTMVRYDSRPAVFTAHTLTVNPKTLAPAANYTPHPHNVRVA